MRMLRITLLGLIVLWAAGARANSLVGPYGFGWQHLGALYSLIARNFHRYGLIDTRCAQVRNAELAARDEWVFYTHHPPGMGLTTAAVASVIGEGPLSVKVPGLLFSLLQVVVTYALVARVLSPRAGLAAAFATAVLPAGSYFATHGSDLGPQAISLALLALLADQRARDRPRPPHEHERLSSAAALAALAGSLFFDWPALIVAGFIALRDFVGRRFRRGFLFAAVVPIAIGVHLAHVRFATGSFGGGHGGSIFEALVGHGLGMQASLVGVDDVELVARRLQRHMRFLFTDAGLIVAALGLVVATWWARWRDDPAARFSRRAWTTLAALAALALLYSLPFARAVVVHRFWLIVALPLVAFLIGALVHASGSSRYVIAAWIVAAVGFGGFCTWRVVELQRADQTPYYEELGLALQQRVPPHQTVLTTERYSECLIFYSKREMMGDLSDATLASLMTQENAALPRSGWFAIVEPPVAPKESKRERLLRLLEEHWEPERVPLPRTGSTLLLFDLSRRRSGG